MDDNNARLLSRDCCVMTRERARRRLFHCIGCVTVAVFVRSMGDISRTRAHMSVPSRAHKNNKKQTNEKPTPARRTGYGVLGQALCRGRR